MEKTAAMVHYYTVGIFKGSEHPVEKYPERKLNPMQRTTYFLLKVVLFPFQIITGLVYLYYNSLGGAVSLEKIAFLHTAGSFCFLAFLIIHVYLATTGETVLSHFKAMVTGWEEVEVEKVTPAK
jgi:thiosulfate reductase cytochrome b subunit